MPDIEPLQGETPAQAEARVRDWRARSALRGAPELVRHVRELVDGGKAEAGETLREWSAPMRITAADDVDSVYAQLINWVTYWAETLGLEVPAITRVAWSNLQEVQGFRAGVTPAGAEALTRSQTMWLLNHAEEIAKHPVVEVTNSAGEVLVDAEGEPILRDDAAVYQDDVTAIIRSTRLKYPTKQGREKPTSSRACPVCGEYAVQGDWVGDDVSDVVVACEHCGWEVPPRYYSRMLDYLVWRDPATDRADDDPEPWLPGIHILDAAAPSTRCGILATDHRVRTTQLRRYAQCLVCQRSTITETDLELEAHEQERLNR